MTPRELDWLCNGVPVKIYRRLDGSVHATIHDFERFGVKPVETVRVTPSPTSTVESIENDPEVVRRLAALTRKPETMFEAYDIDCIPGN